MIYLDNASIAKPKKEVIDVVTNILNNHWYNPSSAYQNGLDNKSIIENTRKLIANEISCNPNEIIFCGSGSEANSLAIDGWLKANNKEHFVTSTIEHSSILNNDKIHKYISCDKNGLFNIDEIKQLHDELVSLQFSNNETGTIQDMKAIVDVLHENNCIVHSDAVQMFGHAKINLKDIKLDMMSATSQKIGGIVGSAFLYVRNGIKLNSIIYGTQENSLRGSTYNTPAIAAFGKAVELIDYNNEKEIKAKRKYLLDKLLSIDCVYLNGTDDLDKRLSNNINIRFDINMDSQQMLAILEVFGYMCSSSSACHAGDQTPSHVLRAIGLNDKDALRSIRITISNDNTYEELDKFYNDFKNVIEQFRV